jgi:hypothetical protein
LQSAALFSTHVLEHHAVTACHDCGETFNVKSYPEHVNTHSRQQALKPTILQVPILLPGTANHWQNTWYNGKMLPDRMSIN